MHVGSLEGMQAYTVALQTEGSLALIATARLGLE